MMSYERCEMLSRCEQVLTRLGRRDHKSTLDPRVEFLLRWPWHGTVGPVSKRFADGSLWVPTVPQEA